MPRSVLVITEGPLDRRNGAGCRAIFPYLQEGGVTQVESWFTTDTGYFGDSPLSNPIRYVNWSGRFFLPRLGEFCRALIRIRQFDRILLVPDGWRGVWLGMWARLVNRNVCFWMMDDWIDSGGHSKHSWKVALKKRLFRILWARAALRLAVSQALSASLAEKFGRPADAVLGRTVLSAELPKRTNRIPGVPLRLVWIGSFLPFYQEPIRTMMRIFEADEDLARCFQLDLYGILPPSEGWTRPNIQYKGALPDEALLKTLTMYDAGVVTYSADESTRQYLARSFPSKLADYLAAALPVFAVLPEGFDVCDALTHRNIGLVVTDASESAVRNGLQRLLRTRSDDWRLWSDHSRQWVLEEFIRTPQAIAQVIGA